MFGDCVSANIVGYQSKLTAGPAIGETYGVVCAMFNQISTEGMKLSQITETGYKDSFFARALGAPVIELSTMNPGGKTVATYRWYDEFEGDIDSGEGVWIGGYWKNEKTDKIVGTGVGQEDVYMRAGDCYWIHTPITEEEYPDIEAVNLLFNGEVLSKSFGFVVCDGVVDTDGYSGLGNMMATPVGLTEITEAGYKDSFFARAMGAPVVELSTVNPGGKTVTTYRWYDEFEGDIDSGEGVWIGGYWKNEKTDKIVVAKGQVKNDSTEEEEVTLNPGDGLWLHTPNTEEYPDLEQVLLLFPKKF